MPINWHCHSSLALLLHVKQSPVYLFPTVLKHYLKCRMVVTNHLDSLFIVTSIGDSITFPSIIKHVKGKVLDYHLFHVVHPKQHNHSVLPLPNANVSHSHPLLTHELIHQHLVLSCVTTIDKICTNQSMTGFPKHPFPKHHCQCPICALATMASPSRGFFYTSLLRCGQLLGFFLSG